MIFVTAMEVVKSEQEGGPKIRQSEAPQEIGSKSLADFAAPPPGSAWLAAARHPRHRGYQHLTTLIAFYL